MPATKNINAEKIQGNLDINSITANTISATTYQNLPIDPDTYVTGFTYSSNTISISDNSGNTFNVTIDEFTGLTINGNLNVTGNTIIDSLTANTISATTYLNLPTDFNTFVTGFTYSSNTFTIFDNSGNTFNANFSEVTGLTINGDFYVTGNTSLDGLSANTISATTYQNLPIDPDTYTTGFTYSSNTFTIVDNSGNTFNATINEVSGLTINGDLSANGITANTISATTYQNLPIDPDTYVTGFTYSSNTFSISDNSGNTFNATFDEVTGLTVNGTLSATTISANTIGNVQYIDFDTTQTGTTAAEGRLFWDVNNRTLSLGMIGGPVQQIGEEQYYLVENQTTGTLNDGTVVRAAGTTGASGKILVDYMIANGTIPAFTTLGVLTQSLASGDTGYVTSFGLVRGLDTTGSLYGETWFDGTILYVSPTILGGFTSVKPINPNLDIIIAIVMKAGSGTTGSIFVRPDVYRPFKDPNRIIVAKQNGDFTSIKDALDTITTSSSSNRYVIDVGPGEFYEPTLDLVGKPYVSIVGSNIQTTLIIPTGSTQHIVNIGINNEISFLSFSGAGSGYAAIHCDNIGDFAQAHKCSFYDCDINVLVKSSTQDTKFYGEYLDFNGTYTYGTKVEATNGYLALANMENYFNFPIGSNITYCNWATGSGATLNIFLGDNISNGISGTTAFYIQDSAQLNASTITSDGCTYAVRNPNIGSPCRFDIDGASFVNGEWDLYIENTSTFGTFQGSSDHSKLYVQSPDVYWVLLDINDGELDITRKGSVTFTDGSHTDFTTLIFEGSTMGVMDGGTITSVSALTINTEAGYGYLETSADVGIIRRIDWNDTTLTLSANTENYIYINENGTLTSSGSIPNTFFNILMGRVVTNNTGVEFIDQSPQNANHTSNRFSTFNRTALGPVYATGSIVTEGTTAFTLDVSAGDYFFSENQIMPSGGTPITFTQYYRNGTGATWITSATTLVNNTQYDNNGTLSTLTGFTKHTLYVIGDGVDEKYFLVLGQNQYDTLVQTESALLPTPPTYFDDAVTQIANIYIESGNTNIVQVEDIRPVIGFKAGGVNASSVHANLLGLSSDDHIQYLLVNGGRAMSGNLDMGTNNIVSAGTVNGVTIQSHGTRHQFGGSDSIGTTTPTPNAIPYADVSGKLDSWISTATTTNLGLVKLSTSPIIPSIPIVVGENDTRFQTSFTGASFNDSTDTLTLNRVNGTSLSVTGLSDYFVTGFSYNNANTISLQQNNNQNFNITLNLFTGLTATTISATTYQNLPTDFNTFTTAFTYNNNTFTISDNSGNTFNASINTVTGLTINGNLSVTGTASSNAISATTISGGTFYGNGSNLTNVVNSITATSGLSGNTTTGNVTIINTSPDQIVTISGGTGILTGGTYPNFTITNTLPDQTVTISGGTGILTGGTYPNFSITNTAPDQTVTISGGTGILTGGTYPNFQITNTAPDQLVTISGGTGITTGGTYPNFTLVNSSPDQVVTISGGTGILTGGTYPNFEITNTAPDQIVTISGGTGITTGGTYPNFSITNSSPDQIVTISGGTGITTGGTYPNFTITNNAPDQIVTITPGFGMSVTGTYPNFTIANSGETFVTGATYNNNTFTFTNNTGGTFSVNFNTVTGLTVNGNLNVTGTTILNSLTATTISATTYSNLPPDVNIYNSDGTLTSNRVVTLAGNTLTFDDDIFVNTITVGEGGAGGAANTILGYDIFNSLNAGQRNVAIGYQSSSVIVDGTENVSVGYLSLSTNADGNSNVAIGAKALRLNTVNSNTSVGSDSMSQNSTGTENTAIGAKSMSLNQTGNYNVGVGFESLYNNIDGTKNVSIGHSSSYSATTANQNVSVGAFSLFGNVSGFSNVAVGYQSLFSNKSDKNTAVGDGSLFSNVSGNGNTAIGWYADVGSSNLFNATAIGAGAIVNTSNSLVLGNNANVGIGTSSPTEKLDVNGRTKTVNFTMTSGATNGYVLKSDSSGNASWSPLSAITGYVDVFVTGGTYNNSNGTATFTNNTGGTFTVTGFTTGGTGSDTYVTGVTYSANTLTISQNQGQSPINTTIGLKIKSGTVTAVSFAGNPKKYTVTFTNAYPDTNYSIGITGADNRVFTYESKLAGSFVINTNSNTGLSGNVDWQTIATGES